MYVTGISVSYTHLFFSEKDLWTRPSINAALERAAELKKTEITALLTEEKALKFRAKKKSFEL